MAPRPCLPARQEPEGATWRPLRLFDVTGIRAVPASRCAHPRLAPQTTRARMGPSGPVQHAFGSRPFSTPSRSTVAKDAAWPHSHRTSSSDEARLDDDPARIGARTPHGDAGYCSAERGDAGGGTHPRRRRPREARCESPRRSFAAFGSSAEGGRSWPSPIRDVNLSRRESSTVLGPSDVTKSTCDVNKDSSISATSNQPDVNSLSCLRFSPGSQIRHHHLCLIWGERQEPCLRTDHGATTEHEPSIGERRR